MKLNILSAAWIAALLLGACNVPTPTPEPTETPIPTATETPTMPPGKHISAYGVDFTIPTELGADAATTIIPAVEGSMGEYPAHIEFTVQGYNPTWEYAKPQIRVVAVEELLKNNQGANTLTKLQAVLSNPSEISLPNADTVPSSDVVARVMTAANQKPLSPAGISGTRAIVGFGGMAIAPMVTEQVMYQFQGLTTDGKFYVTARFPLSVPFLSSGNAPVPPGGVFFQMDPAAQTADFYTEYLRQIAERLAAAEADGTLQPSIALMDELVDSIRVNSAGVVIPAPIAKPSETPAPLVQPCSDSAQYVSDDDMDGTSYEPNTPFVKTWRVKNIGTCVWNSSYLVSYVSGANMAQSPSYSFIPQGGQVPPGDEVDVAVSFAAPNTLGNHRADWRIQTPGGTTLLTLFLTLRVRSGGEITNKSLTVEQEQGSGAICTEGSSYFVSVNVATDGPLDIGYEILVSSAGGQVWEGALQSDGTGGVMVFTAAGSQSQVWQLTGPYSNSDDLTVTVTFSDGSALNTPIRCE